MLHRLAQYMLHRQDPYINPHLGRKSMGHQGLNSLYSLQKLDMTRVLIMQIIIFS
jgi:hypothetical protein